MFRLKSCVQAGEEGYFLPFTIKKMYQAIKTSSSEFITLRNQRYHVRTWGNKEKARQTKPLVLVHGWMDVSASFQFVVDALCADRFIIAPDWRGFGLTKSVHSKTNSVDHFLFADYLGDLDFLLKHYFGEASVDLVGHSMGGNISMIYSGVRPERINKLINLEGFGMASTRPAQAAAKYAKWLNEIEEFHKGKISLKPYKSLAEVANRLVKNNPRISMDKANWLANHWAQEDAEGMWRILGEPAHKISSVHLYRADEASEIHKLITAPVLFVIAQDNGLQQWFREGYKIEEFYERMKVIKQIEFHQLKDTGHMLHHDQPLALAKVIESFLEKNR